VKDDAICAPVAALTLELPFAITIPVNVPPSNLLTLTIPVDGVIVASPLAVKPDKRPELFHWICPFVPPAPAIRGTHVQLPVALLLYVRPFEITKAYIPGVQPLTWRAPVFNFTENGLVAVLVLASKSGALTINGGPLCARALHAKARLRMSGFIFLGASTT
jgi:hypothetical protein